MFNDRTEAGQQLAQKIQDLKISLKEDRSLVLALPRGGVLAAAEIAQLFKLPLDIIVTRKIGHPSSSEYAIAAVGEHSLVLNPSEEIDINYLNREKAREHQEIKRRLLVYRGKRPSPEIKNKNIILVDDGLATGLTMEAAIAEVKFFHPYQIILAVPVAPPETIQRLKHLVDKIVVLLVEPKFWAVGQFYHQFPEVSDEEVKNLLVQSWRDCGDNAGRGETV